ncbi:DUF4169 family protein [Novosphingobium sp. ZW T3_23]|uniref:DUF4169 family protein n=1 Tax=Novosphingobium sp. ZW T3_23 TaxID=3378084 RepID=UPI00385297CE
MAQIINLRMARKARTRDAAQQQAQASRARHGRTKSERDAAEAETARLDRVVDGAKRERPEDGSN